MIPLEIILDGQGCWPDLQKKKFQVGKFVAVAGLPHGTQRGKPTVSVRIEVDGEVVLAETTLALFLTAADALKVKYGDPREE